ncbi:MAG TPA: MaoC family dehydratase N-terminal domain-containing protein [Actinomycetota bacterium]|jgi:acyl dehydratase|nr:MaoC family dehydratase N-terminal domain-containing protein [Actinomycetota bacterium]
MPLNQDLVGKIYPSITYEVGREKLREFAAAVGETSPVYHDVEAAKELGYSDHVAPPTFATVLHILSGPAVLSDPELRLDYSRVVHGEQEFEYRRPITAGDVLTATPRIADISSRGPLEFLRIETTIADEAGEVVVVARATLISRGMAGGS